MRWLVIGAGGMAGHMLVGYLQKHGAGELFYTARNKNLKGACNWMRAMPRQRRNSSKACRRTSSSIVRDCSMRRPSGGRRILRDQRFAAAPLRRLADRTGARLIQISTDCVFSGARGNYAEHDPPDGQTVYARSKALGEIADPRISPCAPRLSDRRSAPAGSACSNGSRKAGAR